MIGRSAVGDATTGRLFFAQVREDPELELSALAAHLDGPIVIVSSGGCTALSLVAAGAAEVISVDSNRTQNNLVELKAVAVAALGGREASAFLGGAQSSPAKRRAAYGLLRDRLGEHARAYWDAHPRSISSGVLGAGATERFLAVFAAIVRRAVHPPERIRGLLACETIEEQRAYYRQEWDTRRWRALFEVLLNRFVFQRVYDPAFFAHVDNSSFAGYFRESVELGLTELPIGSNYFFHYILTGRYPLDAGPPYLDEANDDRMAEIGGRLRLVDGGLGEYLRACPSGSIAGFALSNICEWLTAEEIDALIAEVVRAAQPGARLCLRNFVGWTELPARWLDVVRVDEGLSEKLSRRDRSLVQRRIVVADIRKP